jgi:uncharacterized protein
VKKAIIIHGWEGSPDVHWFQDEKAALEAIGYSVVVPQMPNPAKPKLSEWLTELNKLEIDQGTIIIGHSLGVPIIFRYLEQPEKHVDKVFSVAGFARHLELNYPNSEYPNSFVQNSFDWKKIKASVNRFYIINQDNDGLVPLEEGIYISSSLDTELIVAQGNNHFDTMDLDLINRYL